MAVHRHLSTGPPKPLRVHRYVGISAAMSADRIASAIARIEAAIERIDGVRDAVIEPGAKAGAGSAKVVELVNAHEKLREQVSESLRELDDFLAKLEDES
jgi:hypothetical protein